MLHAIPNPQKSFQVNFNLEYTNKAINHIVLYSEKYKLTEANLLLNKCVYETTEFLSLGVFIDVSATYVAEGISQITITVRRKIGTFNQAHEVTLANTHISNLETLISQSLGDNESDRIIKMREKTDLIQIKKDEHNRKVEENKEKDRVERENEPLLYYTKQFLLVLATIGLIGGFIYLVIKLVQ